MTRKILEQCPSCGGPLEITEVRCTRCETQVRARYRPCDFCALTDEQSTFLRLFVMSRGNLSEVEKRLGVSYPTVRAKLDEVIARLGASDPAPAPPVRSTAERSPLRVEGPRRGDGEPPEPGAEPSALGAAWASGSGEPRGEAVRPAGPAPGGRRAILDAIARGEISAEEGAARMRGLNRETNR